MTSGVICDPFLHRTPCSLIEHLGSSSGSSFQRRHWILKSQKTHELFLNHSRVIKRAHLTHAASDCCYRASLPAQGIKPRWYSQVNPSSQTPCVRTREGKVVTESLRIIETLDDLFPDNKHRLFPADPALKEEAVRMMNSFSSVFPSGTRPSSRGSFLYKGSLEEERQQQRQRQQQ